MNYDNVLIIAEVGVNHNGNLETALKLVDEAKNAGADIVKFQTFDSSELASEDAQLVDYQKTNLRNIKNQKDMLSLLELREEETNKIILKCEDVGIEYLTTAFDNKSLEKISKLNLQRFKIPSGEITNLPYLRRIGSFKKPIILSTGMAYLSEVAWAVNKLIESGTPKDKITILHCTSEYPCPFNNVNLEAINTISKTFKVDVGYSDHTLGIEVAIAAVALGAKVIEKHITLNKNMSGPDHKASIEPYEFQKMVKSIRNIEKSFGNGIKSPTEKELITRKSVRKSILASKEIKVDDYFSEENLVTKRPLNGISPIHWDDYIGKKSKNNYLKDDLIKE
jgi:N,N'-diacetyllegionaminate synthase